MDPENVVDTSRRTPQAPAACDIQGVAAFDDVRTGDPAAQREQRMAAMLTQAAIAFPIVL